VVVVDVVVVGVEDGVEVMVEVVEVGDLTIIMMVVVIEMEIIREVDGEEQWEVDRLRNRIIVGSLVIRDGDGRYCLVQWLLYR
jgi:hypothetical protein